MSAVTALQPPIDPASGTAKSTVVFICYRHSDGDWHADWIDQALNGWTPADAPSVSTYFDRTAPAVADWKKHHLPSLQSAHTLIVICTPGAAVDLSSRDQPDWVYEEINWWIANRNHPPIVVDATGEGARWVPTPIKRKWPDLNRVLLERNEAEAGTQADRERFRARWREQIGRSLEQGNRVSTFENVERLEAANRRLRRSNIALTATLGLALLLVAAAYWQYDRASSERSKAQTLNHFLGGLFYSADPDRQVGRIVTAAQLLDSGVHELQQTKDPQTRFEMLVAIGASYTGLGEHQKAIKLLTEANDLAKTLDLNDDARFRLGLGFGEALLYQNRFNEARPHLNTALELAPTDVRERSRTLVALGDLEAWSEDGDRDQARQHYEAALALDEKDGRALDVARDANRLGYLALDDGNATEAERRYKQARDAVAKEPDGAAVLLAQYESDVAATQYSLGKITAARLSFEKSRATLAKTYGEVHGEVAVIDNNIARARIEEGDLGDVEARLVDAVERMRGAYGAEFSGLALAYNNLGLMQLARSDTLAAQNSLNTALSIATKNAMPIAAQTLVHLSEVRMSRREYPAAAELLEDAERVLEANTISDWRRAIYESALGELAVTRCDLAGAAPLLEKSQMTFSERWKKSNVFVAAGERRLALLADAKSGKTGCKNS